MAKLVYTAITSLDLFIEDATGDFEWAAPDDEVHAFLNDRERGAATYLLGRRTYETLAVWDHPEAFAGDSAPMLDFASIWKAADKIVYSKTIDSVSTARTRIEREFDPDAVRQLKATSQSDISIGGPEFAAHAFRAGLIDECLLYLNPIIIGAGKPAFPSDLRLDLELQEERRFASGVTFLRYTTKR